MKETTGGNYTRAEMIQQARDQFNRNKDNASVVKRASGYYDDKETAMPMPKGKSFLIRAVIAGILFLLVLTMDQMSLSYNEIKSSSIQEMIGSNQIVETIQDVTTDFAEEKIIPVFHRLW